MERDGHLCGSLIMEGRAHLWRKVVGISVPIFFPSVPIGWEGAGATPCCQTILELGSGGQDDTLDTLM